MSDCISTWGIPTWSEDACVHQTLPYIQAHTLVAEKPHAGPTLATLAGDFGLPLSLGVAFWLMIYRLCRGLAQLCSRTQQRIPGRRRCLRQGYRRGYNFHRETFRETLERWRQEREGQTREFSEGGDIFQRSRCVCTPDRSRFLTRQADLCAHEIPLDEYGLLLVSRANERLRKERETEQEQGVSTKEPANEWHARYEPPKSAANDHIGIVNRDRTRVLALAAHAEPMRASFSTLRRSLSRKNRNGSSAR